MLVNLNDPESILSWWKVWPARHSVFLEHKPLTSPEFASAIREAQRRIAADPMLTAMLARSVLEARDAQSRRFHRAVVAPAYELRLREFAEAA